MKKAILRSLCNGSDLTLIGENENLLKEKINELGYLVSHNYECESFWNKVLELENENIYYEVEDTSNYKGNIENIKVVYELYESY